MNAILMFEYFVLTPAPQCSIFTDTRAVGIICPFVRIAMIIENESGILFNSLTL